MVFFLSNYKRVEYIANPESGYPITWYEVYYPCSIIILSRLNFINTALSKKHMHRRPMKGENVVGLKSYISTIVSTCTCTFAMTVATASSKLKLSKYCFTCRRHTLSRESSRMSIHSI